MIKVESWTNRDAVQRPNNQQATNNKRMLHVASLRQELTYPPLRGDSSGLQNLINEGYTRKKTYYKIVIPQRDDYLRPFRSRVAHCLGICRSLLPAYPPQWSSVAVLCGMATGIPAIPYYHIPREEVPHPRPYPQYSGVIDAGMLGYISNGRLFDSTSHQTDRTSLR